MKKLGSVIVLVLSLSFISLLLVNHFILLGRASCEDIIWVRGEKVKIKGTSSLPAGSRLVLSSIPSLSTLFENTNKIEYIYVGADGKFEKEFKIKPDAPLTTYYLRISSDEFDLSDTIVAKVVKQELSCTITENSKSVEVIKGGSIRVTGTTTLDYVIVCASADDVFEGVKKIGIGKFSIEGHKTVAVGNGFFNFTLKVKENAQPGYYMLYLFAPSRDILKEPVIDPAEDLVKIFVVHVKNPEIVPLWYNISISKSKFNLTSNSTSFAPRKLTFWL